MNNPLRALSLIVALSCTLTAQEPGKTQPGKTEPGKKQPGKTEPEKAQPAKAEASAEVRAFLDEWSKAMAGVKSLRVTFKQIKHLRILKKPLERSGQTLLLGRRVLMVVNGKDGKPETELLVVPGEARLHYPRLGRMEVFPVSEGKAPPTPFPLFGADLSELPQRYLTSLRVDPQDPRKRTLELVPRDKQSPLAKTTMQFVGTRILRVEQESKRGDKVEIHVSTFERNPKLDPATLRLSTTPKTRVVRPTGP